MTRSETSSGHSIKSNLIMQQVGVVGLGLLGGAMAERLMDCGYKVFGYDVDNQRQDVMAQHGVAIVEDAQTLFQSVKRVILSLPTSNHVAEVLTTISDVLTSDHILIDTTTGVPSQMIIFGEQMALQNACYLDASVAGSSELARSGKVVLLVGGEENAFARCTDLFESLASDTYHVGPTGAGAKLKLVHNLLLGLHRAVLAEALCFAESLELDVEKSLSILKDTVAYSKVMDLKGDKMVTRDFTPQATLSQHLKDVQLMLAEAEQSGQSLPLTSLHRALLEQAELAGFGSMDNSAIIHSFLKATNEE